MTLSHGANKLDSFTKRPKRALWSMALPMMTGFAVHSLYLIADMAFIGRISSSALAGAQFVGSFMYTAIAVNIGLATGVTAVIAQAVGRGDRVGAGRIAAAVMGLSLIMGAVPSFIGFVWGSSIIPLLGAQGESAVLGAEYFQILVMGVSFMFFTGVIRAVLTGEGDAKTPMIIGMVSAALNCALDPLLIFVVGMGIRGAAVATVISQLLSLVAFCYVAFVKRRSYVLFTWSLRSLLPKAQFISPVLKIGLPSALGQFIISIGSILYNRVTAEFGQTAVAGYGAASKVDLLVMLPIMGLASSALSIVGIFRGANRHDLVKSSILYAFRSVFYITLGLSVVAFFFSYKIVGIFTDDAHALSVGHVYLRYMVFAYPLMAVGIMSGRVLQGLGQGFPPLIITAMRVLFIAVPVSYISVFFFDASIEAIWKSMIFGGAAAAAAAVFWIYRFVWKNPPTQYPQYIPSDFST